jgi:hypothetical protein
MTTIQRTGARNFWKLFAVALPTCLLLTAGLPLMLVFADSALTRSIFGFLLGAVIIVGSLMTFRIAREQGLQLTRSMLLFCFLVAWSIANVSGFFESRTSSGCRTTPGRRTVCSGPDIVHASPAVWVLLGLAVVILFASLLFAPSHEKELSRRIDLEACGITVPLSLFFFLTYWAFENAGLPPFSTGVGIGTLLVSYLLGRLALTLKYR